MRPYQVASLVLVSAGVAFVIGLKVGEGRSAAPKGSTATPADSPAEECCVLPESAAQTGEPPNIPSGSDRPCLVEFGSNECDQCKQMHSLLDELAPGLQGKVDVVRLDTDLFPQEARRWQLRLIPTQIFFNAAGEEVDRHEGALSADDLLARLRLAGAELD